MISLAHVLKPHTLTNANNNNNNIPYLIYIAYLKHRDLCCDGPCYDFVKGKQKQNIST